MVSKETEHGGKGEQMSCFGVSLSNLLVKHTESQCWLLYLSMYTQFYIIIPTYFRLCYYFLLLNDVLLCFSHPHANILFN